MATFVPFTHWLPVRAEQLEFGRSKKEGMPKTKKKTVEVLETSSTVEVDTAMLKIDSELSNRGREPQGAVGDCSRGHGEPASVACRRASRRSPRRCRRARTRARRWVARAEVRGIALRAHVHCHVHRRCRSMHLRPLARMWRRSAVLWMLLRRGLSDLGPCGVGRQRGRHGRAQKGSECRAPVLLFRAMFVPRMCR